ncbi:Arginase/deacetylase [Dacryopinax primogenitus]|uniref:Arginase/deacetylase n=1 Tax=Dacryopinax primogenitus (strain DJM 731) TaxID=1858805 RepID=M5FYY7_DACPD|nr:Arginase/deacetylase [Dacryopinax primogenitus]EJU03261.1 Arginase/deacetylase [Dacryopinax primogenitus]
MDPREVSIDRILSSALDALSISHAPPEDPEILRLPPLPSPEKARTLPHIPVALFSAPACALHTYIRTSHISTIVERPQRLRAVAVGLACGLARLEDALHDKQASLPDASSLGSSAPDFLQLVSPAEYRAIDIRTHEATRYVHNKLADLEEERDPDSTEKAYIGRLHELVETCVEKITVKQSEIPEEWPQGDLYLSPGSMAAFQSSIATVCASVDLVVSPASPKRAFVSVRPPGHHCSSATPSGFCFLNNVAIAAVHANLSHSITHVAILDIDLHHGNGTQAIAWAINAETNKRNQSEEQPQPDATPGLQIYYGSMHDILSYPCELGDPALTQAASICIHGGHGQHIENIHLEPYTSDEDFWGRLYPQKYSQLLKKADDFFKNTGAEPHKSLVLVSCGFDACSHEMESMSRHKRNVPPTFYGRFAADAKALADKWADGRIVTVLEGGYGDRALQSGSMAYLVGLFLTPEEVMRRTPWWSLDELIKIEKAFPPPKASNRRAPVSSTSTSPYLVRALSLLPLVFPPLSPEEQPLPRSAPGTPAQPHRMGLRDRKTLKPAIPAETTPPRSGTRTRATRGKRGGKSNANTPSRLPEPSAAEEPSTAGATTTEIVPPRSVSDSDLGQLASSMQDLKVKMDPEPSPPLLDPFETNRLSDETQIDPQAIPEAETTERQSLKVKLHVPRAIMEQWRAQGGQPGISPGSTSS